VRIAERNSGGSQLLCPLRSPVSVAQLGPVYVPPAPPPAEEIPGPQKFALPQVRPKYAGFWLRAVASLIDRVILSFLFVLIASFRPAVFLILPDPNTQLHLPRRCRNPLSVPHPTPAGFLVLLLLMWIYYAAFEASSWQATPGKKYLGCMLRMYSAVPLHSRALRSQHWQDDFRDDVLGGLHPC